MTDTPHVRACGALIDELGGLVRLNRVISGDVGRRTGLAPTQLSLLGMLDALGEARLADVAEQHMVDPSVISRQIAGLEQSGHVHRRPDPADRRAALVSLTEHGREMLAEARSTRRAWVSAALSEWSPADLERLTAALERIGAQLETARAQGGRAAVGA